MRPKETPRRTPRRNRAEEEPWWLALVAPDPAFSLADGDERETGRKNDAPYHHTRVGRRATHPDE